MSKKEIEIYVDKDNRVSFHDFIEMKIKYDEEYFKKDKEIERLNNIIKELEKWLEERLEKLDIYGYDDDVFNGIELASHKLQELKGSDKE